MIGVANDATSIYLRFSLENLWPVSQRLHKSKFFQTPLSINTFNGYAHKDPKWCWNNNVIINGNTVKPVYNGHPWDLKKVAVWKRCLIKLIFNMVVNVLNWPLLTGGCYSQVVVNSGLTLHQNRFSHKSIYCSV
jgi:hypothetical protein